MAAEPSIYTFIDPEDNVEKTISEKQLSNYIQQDVESRFDKYEKKHNIQTPEEFASKNHDRNDMFKVYLTRYNSQWHHVMVFKGYWIHALGLLRLLLGKDIGTRVYLQRPRSNDHDSNSLMWVGNFIKFDYLNIGLAYFDHDSFPCNLIEKMNEFESNDGISDLNMACEYSFSNKMIRKRIGSIGSRAGRKTREVLERFSPKVFESGKLRVKMDDALSGPALEHMKVSYRGILSPEMEKEIIADVQDQIKHERNRPAKQLKKRQRKI